MKARYVWIDLGGNQEYLTISDINIVADDSLGFGWTPSQKNRIENNGDMSSDYLVQASIKPTTNAKWEMSIPSGNYYVVIGLGTTNAKFTTGLKIEGIEAFDDTSAYDNTLKVVWAQEFRDVKKLVQITDGKLTLEFTNDQTRICYIRVFTDRYQLQNSYSITSSKSMSKDWRRGIVTSCNAPGFNGRVDFCPIGTSSTTRSKTDRGGRNEPILGIFTGHGDEKKRVLKYEKLGAHDSLRISLKFWAIDSWDGSDHAYIKVYLPNTVPDPSSCSPTDTNHVCWRYVWRKRRGHYHHCRYRGWKSFYGQLDNPWAGNHPSYETDSYTHKCHADADLTFDHTSDTLMILAGVTMTAGINDESWGLSDLKVYTMTEVTSFAIGDRVNFGSGSQVKVMSYSKKECQKKGGDLVVIPNEAKNTKVIEFMKTKDVEEYEGGYNIQRTGRCSDISGALPITNKQECWDARDSLGYSGASVGSWSW